MSARRPDRFERREDPRSDGPAALDGALERPVTAVGRAGLGAFLNGYQGLLQRVAAATLLGSVGFAAWLLRRPTIG